MKKLLVMLAAVATIGAVAQNVDAVQKKIDKSNADIVDAKKSTQAATWLNRANAYIEMANIYTSKIVPNITIEQATSMIGKPLSSVEVQVSGNTFVKNDYENFIIYSDPASKMIQFFQAKKGDELSDLNNALAALTKMKELNEKDFTNKGMKIAESLKNLFQQTGMTAYNLDQKAKAASFFDGAANTSILMGKIDTLIIYYSGIAYTEAQEWNKGISLFDKILAIGDDQGGMVQLYMSMCYEGIKDDTKAISILESGFQKNPNNASILSAIINIYLKNEIDPVKLIDIIKKAEELDPKNASLYLVEGTVWEKLGDTDKAIGALKKSIEIDNKNYYAYFNLGFILTNAGNACSEKASKVDLNDQAGYDKLIAEQSEYYTQAIEALEMAHQINSEELGVIELLKGLYFQKRDKGDEFAAKSKYYEELYQSKSGK